MIKITLIYPHSFGYIGFLNDYLREKKEVDLTSINFSELRYRYHSKRERIYNAYKKILWRENLKDEYRTNQIHQKVKAEKIQDFIVIVRPDLLEDDLLKVLREYTQNLYAFYFDAISNFPRKKTLFPFFDKVFSYEKEDVERYGLEFITNYIYDRQIEPCRVKKYKIFNISSYDERFSILEKLAKYFTDEHISYHFIVRKERPIISKLIKIVPEYLTLAEVKNRMSYSEVLLDIQKNRQEGLSFRVFEALGFEKKLITTNPSVVHYEFYNPQNICIIDPENPVVPSDFWDTPYEKIPENLLYPYTLEGWVKKVFQI